MTVASAVDSRTILDNVALPLIIRGMKKKEAREKAAPYFAEFGLEGTQKKYPAQLSGGMKQRVSLARAFVHDADLLILDEPTKELDRNLCNVVYEIINEEAEKRAVIIVTHEAAPDWLRVSKVINL